MRPTNQIPPIAKNRSLEEPVYVDEVFPDEVDPWARKEKVETIPEPTLSFEEDDDEEDVEEEPLPIPPTLMIPQKREPTPRSYRVKISPASRRLPDSQRITPHKPLPNELPRPTRQDRGIPPRETHREERTRSWPVTSNTKRNQTSPTQNGHSTPSERVPSAQPSHPKENDTPPVRYTPPVHRTERPPASPPIPVIPLPPVEPPPTSERRLPTRPSPDAITPPPILPVMPPRTSSPPQRVYPVESPTPQTTHFQPLVEEDPNPNPTDETENPTEDWAQVSLSRNRLGVSELIDSIALPQNSLILGVCDDGLPLVLELSDPSPGALLFLGDDVNGLRKHLQAVLASVCTLSDPKQVQIDIISPQPDTFAAQKRLPHIQKIHLPDQDEMFDLLGCLFELIEQRQRKDNSLTGKLMKEFLPKPKGPVRILMIDQLDVLVEYLAPESLAYLRWLLRRGPAANVWVLASLNAQNAQTVDGKTLKSFGLQITGKMQTSPQVSRLTTIPLNHMSHLVPGEQACLKLDEDVIEFSILEIEA